MAALVLLNPRLAVATIDMSSFVTAVELPIDVDTVETTNAGSAGWRTYLPALKKATVKVGWNDDFATTTVDDRIWGWLGTTVALNVRPTNSAISTTNPEYQMSVVVNSFSPVSGKIGELLTQELTWQVTGAITRATS